MQETPYVIEVQKNAPIIPDEEAPLQSPMAIYIYEPCNYSAIRPRSFEEVEKQEV